MPLRALLDQFAPNFPGFCKVGMGHNKKIDFDAKGVTGALRISPHYYNTESEIDGAIEALADLVRPS